MSATFEGNSAWQTIAEGLWNKPRIVLLISLLSGALGFLLFLTTKPVYSDASWYSPTQPQTNFEFPFLEEKGEPSEKVLQFHMTLGRIHPSRFVAHVRDVVPLIHVNGQEVFRLKSLTPPYDQETMDLGSALKVGDNVIKVKIANLREVSHFYWLPSLKDPWFLAIAGLGLVSLGFGLRWIRLIRSGWLTWPEALVLFVAISLRLIYVCGTPYSIRAYDWEGHLDYIQYVAKNLAFPAFDSGWETFQPPLFYGIYGLLGHVVYALGGSYDLALILWQAGSLAISALTLAAALWAAHALFPGPANKWRLLFLAIVGAIPGLAFFASRVSNDTLFALVSFVFLGAFLRYWQDRRWLSWIGVCVLIALGLLTKSTALVFLPIVAMTIFFTPSITWVRKAQLMAVLVATITLIAGWYLVHRAIESGASTSFIIRNLENLPAKQRIDPTPIKFVTFNPIEMLKQPFTWVGDNPRYDRFGEFFFKTALFNEEFPGPSYLFLGRGILACALILLVFAASGMWHTIRSFDSLGWPLLVTEMGFISAQMFGVFQSPYACLQNFRYSIILIIPFVYFVVKGIEYSPRRGQILGVLIAGIFIGLSTLFILAQRGIWS